MLGAIAHVALIVQDPARTAAFLQDLFEAPLLKRRDEDGHDETFIRLGVTWFVLVKADVKREKTGDHVAFRVAPEAMTAKLKSKGCEFILSRTGTSLYCFDFDNHIFELDISGEEQELDKLAASSGAQYQAWNPGLKGHLLLVFDDNSWLQSLSLARTRS